MNFQENTNDVLTITNVTENNATCNNHNSKTYIQAKNYNKSKVFDMKSPNSNIDLKRVDSQNYPDATENLDYIANKMGLNQMNNNKPEFTSTTPIAENNCSDNATNTPESVSPNKDKPNTEQGSHKHHKKTNLMTKILRRLSRPNIFTKDKKSKKPKEKQCSDSTRQSLSSDVKSNTISDTVNPTPTRSKSFRQIFVNRFGHKSSSKTKPTIGLDAESSVSSAVNTVTIGDCAVSCRDVYVDKLCKEELQQYNSSSVDCIAEHMVGRPLNPQDTESNASEDQKEHERKMNGSNHHIVSGVTEENNMSQIRKMSTKIDEDKLCPLNVHLNLAPSSADGARSCHSAMSANHFETSSNVKLTLSLHGYSAYGLSSSRFNSKSCMEFRSANISSKSKTSMDNIATYNDKVASTESIGPTDDELLMPEIEDVKEEPEVAIPNIAENNIDLTDTLEDTVKEVTLDVTDAMLRKSNRPTEIQLRKSRVTSQTSMARSSLIMVAVAHNSPRTKGVGSHISTPTYNPDSPGFPGKKLDFDEDNKAILEEKMAKVETEKDGNDFLIIVNQYESEMNEKIEIVQHYLESFQEQMVEDVIGELNTAVGLAKLLLSEKFVQFRTLCDKNLRETTEGEFQTLSCDLEGYLTTLEIQIANLNHKFQSIETIRHNNWQMPVEVCPPMTPGNRKRIKTKTARTTPTDTQRSQEARRRIAQFKKLSSASNAGLGCNLLVIE